MRLLSVVLSGVLLVGLLLWGVGAIDVGLNRWPVKTFRDPDRSRVRIEPVDTTIAFLTRIPRPPDSAFHGRSRIAPAELSVYRVRGRLKRILGGRDGDIHLVLSDPSDPSRTMIAEIPAPFLSLGSGLGRLFAAEREQVRGRPKSRGELVEVTGIGFFDYYAPGSDSRQARNGFELHPVLALKFLGP